jgi:hypothetical protein
MEQKPMKELKPGQEWGNDVYFFGAPTQATDGALFQPSTPRFGLG